MRPGRLVGLIAAVALSGLFILVSHLTHPDIRPSNMFIDAVSLPMVNGSTVDYATELIGSSFRVTANPQAKGGCGCGISWEVNDTYQLS